MFIRQIDGVYNYLNKYKMYTRGWTHTVEGKLPNNRTISITTRTTHDGKPISKQYIINGEGFQKIVNKLFNKETGKFDRMA